MATPVPLGLLAAAGKDPKDITTAGVRLRSCGEAGGIRNIAWPIRTWTGLRPS